MNARPAGREACECASPINQILERLDQMDADIASAQQAANTAVGTATAQAGAAAASAASAQADAAAALINAGAAQDAADDAHDEAVAAAGSAQDAADDAADALLALQNIESTIASVLATDLGGKVDKLTTAGLHLYSHNGSSQGEVAPDINPTATTIPIRDSSGKLFGADPASGATDKTLVTANWVSQTGTGRPNNLVHDNGIEDIYSIKSMIEYPIRNQPVFAQNNTGWHMIYSWNAANTTANQIVLFWIRFKQTTQGIGLLSVDLRATSTNIEWLISASGIPADSVIIARNFATSTAYLYVYGYRIYVESMILTRATSIAPILMTINPDPDNIEEEPVVGDSFDTVVKI